MNTTKKLPYLQIWLDPATGKPRYYYRRRGHQKVHLGGNPATDLGALAKYQSARQGAAVKPRTAAAGSVSAAVTALFEARPKLDVGLRRVLEGFRDRQHGELLRNFKPDFFTKYHNEISEQRSRANQWRKAMHTLFAFAVKKQLIGSNPVDLPRLAPKNEQGFVTWSRAEVAAFRARWPIGTRERLALELLVCVGFRQSDVRRIGRQAIKPGEDGRLRWQFVEAKNEEGRPNTRSVPLEPALVEIMQATPGPTGSTSTWDMLGPFLRNSHGRPFTRRSFNIFFRAACDEAGLPPELGPHGLRKRCAIDLVHAGCTEHEIQHFFAWRDIRQVAVYTRAAGRERLSDAAFDKLMRARSAEQGSTECVS